jgi:hypothetical protein
MEGVPAVAEIGQRKRNIGAMIEVSDQGPTTYGKGQRQLRAPILLELVKVLGTR